MVKFRNLLELLILFYRIATGLSDSSHLATIVDIVKGRLLQRGRCRSASTHIPAYVEQ